MEIGEEKETIVVEPVAPPAPVPSKDPAPVPAEEPVPAFGPGPECKPVGT